MGLEVGSAQHVQVGTVRTVAAAPAVKVLAVSTAGLTVDAQQQQRGVSGVQRQMRNAEFMLERAFCSPAAVLFEEVESTRDPRH